MPPPPPPPRVLPAPASDGTLSLAMASLASDETDEALAPELARLEIVSVMGEGEEAQYLDDLSHGEVFYITGNLVRATRDVNWGQSRQE